MPDLRIVAPETPADFDAVRELCWEYRGFLASLSQFDAELTNVLYPESRYAELLADLERSIAPPSGLIRMVTRGDVALGCGMAKAIQPGTAEIKRVYVVEALRESGTGRALMEALIEACRDQGFDRILMDTIQPLKAAQQLYLSMGFTLRGPYQPVPPEAEGHLLFFEMDLTRSYGQGAV